VEAENETPVIEIAPYGKKNGVAAPPNPMQDKVLYYIDQWRARSLDELADDGKGIPVLYVEGGVGAGKTRGLLAPILEMAVQYPGIRILWGRLDFADLRVSAMETFLEVAGGLVAGKNEQEHRYSIKCETNGQMEKQYGMLSKIFFRELKDLSGLGSQEFAIVVITEAHEISYRAYTDLKGRIRQKPYPLMLLMEGNPPNEGHWLDNICKRGTPEFDDDVTRITVSTYDNWDNLPYAYKKTLEKMPPAWRRKYVEGKVGFIPDGKPFYNGYIENQHTGNFEYIPDKEIIRCLDFGFHHPACYDKNTQILTEKGWKYFRDIEDDEIVYTLNPKTKIIELQQINAKINYNYTGNMYHWHSERNNVIDVNVTENHLMVSYNKRKKDVIFSTAHQVSKLKSRYDLVKNYTWNGADNECFLLPNSDIKISMQTFCEFMGIFLSEGSLNSWGGHYNICIWQKDRKEKIEKTLNKMFCKWSWQKDHWAAASKELYFYLKQFGLSKDKYIPFEIKNLSKKYLYYFLDMYELGDGTKRKNGKCYLVTTVSEKMANDLQELYFKCNLYSRIRYVKREDGKYYYEIRKNQYNKAIFNKNLKINYVTNEPVYCVNVQNHIIYTRRNGHPMWCGNCAWMQFDNDNRLIVLRELMGTDITLERWLQYHLIPFESVVFPNSRFSTYYDIAGKQKTDKTENDCIKIMANFGISGFGKQSTYKQRQELIERLLSQTIKGRPALMIDQKCRIISEGFLGGYHYPVVPQGNAEKEEPFKDGFYEHCLSGDTKIRTLFGWHFIKDLVGKEFITYAYDTSNKRLVPSKAHSCRKTQENVELWKLKFDEGELIATPDHLIMMRDGSYRQLKDLKVDDELMPFYEKQRSYKGHTILNLNDGSIVDEHRYIYNWFNGNLRDGYHVHHKDGNPFNNNPYNLEQVEAKEHMRGVYEKMKKNPTVIAMKKGSLNRWTKESRKKVSDFMLARCMEGNHTFVKRTNKICPICKKRYSGTTRQKYCFNCKNKSRNFRDKSILSKINHKVISIEFYGFGDTYNLEVETHHNFPANGIMVHNCMNCVEYGIINLFTLSKNNNKSNSNYVSFNQRFGRIYG
jgi:hypothetical protein